VCVFVDHVLLFLIDGGWKQNMLKISRTSQKR
jgi:hypothetical protein